MHIEVMPFCCTSLVLGSFGDHGEESIVTVKEIKRLLERNRQVQYTDEIGPTPQRYVYASTINPENVAVLKQAGFKVLDNYPGIQGQVYIMGLHLDTEMQ